MENGQQKRAGRIELQDRIIVETKPESPFDSPAPKEFEFEVIGIVQDAGSSLTYGVCFSEAADEFIITDEIGNLLDDDALAQEILKDFLEQAADTAEQET